MANNKISTVSSSGTEDEEASCPHAKNISFYCIPCREKVCMNCVVTTHMGCTNCPNAMFIRRLAKRTAEEFRKIFKRIESDADDAEEGFSREIDKVKREIEERARSLKLIVETERECLLLRLLEFERNNRKLWAERRRRCADVLGEIRDLEKAAGNVSFSVLSEMVAALMDSSDRLKVAERNNVIFSPAAFGTLRLGRISCPPSATSTTMHFHGEYSTDAVNSFRVTVRDVTDRIVDYADFEPIDLTVRVEDANENCIPIFIENLKNSHYNVTFVPLSAGEHVFHVELNSVPVRGSPMRVEVREKVAAPAEPALVVGKEGRGDGEFCRLWGVCCDRLGRILVTDRCNHRVQIFTRDGLFAGKFGAEGTGPGQFNRPTGITVDKTGRIIVADKDNHRIQLFDDSGTYLSHFGESSEGTSLCYPWDVAVNDRCQIAVTETKDRRVRLFTDAGVQLMVFDFSIHRELNAPRGIASLPDGSYLVTDFNKHKLIALDEKFKKARVSGLPGKNVYEFSRPQGIAAGGDGLFAVSDCKNHRIQVFKNGIPYKILGRFGSRKGELDAPQGVAFHPNGKLIVADFGNSRIQVFDV